MSDTAFQPDAFQSDAFQQYGESVGGAPAPKARATMHAIEEGAVMHTIATLHPIERGIAAT